MGYWSTGEKQGFAVRDDGGTQIATADTQALASQIVNALNHQCIETVCDLCELNKMVNPELTMSRARVCMGHHQAAVAVAKGPPNAERRGR